MKTRSFLLATALSAAAFGQHTDFQSVVTFPMVQTAADPGLEALIVEPDLQQVQNLLQYDTVRMNGMALPGGRTIDLNLERLSIEDRRFQYYVDGQPTPGLLNGQALSVWKGSVEGLDNSDVMLSFGLYGCRGWIQMGHELYHLMPRPDDNGDWTASSAYIISEMAMNTRGFELSGDCQAPKATPLDAPDAISLGGGDGPMLPAGGCSLRECKIALECDTQYYDLFNDINAASAYTTTLWTFINDRYETQTNTTLTFPYVNIPTNGNDPWTSQDSGGSSVDLLYEFQGAWAFNVPNGADVAHFMSGAGLGGGVAWLGVLCNNEFNFAVSGNIGADTPFPVTPGPSNWDFMVCAHELGHNFNSPHTHDFCPPLDECAPSGYFGQCQSSQNCTSSGTIMSYCHLCSGGTGNITTYFHPTAAAEMTMHAANCLPLSSASATGDAPTLLTPGATTAVNLSISESPANAPTLYASLDGGNNYTAIAMSHVSGNDYTADLPAASCGDSPAFYYEVTGLTCGSITVPSNAPGSVYTALVGSAVVAADDDFESASGWTAGIPSDDATTGAWERADPEATEAQPGNDHTPGGGTMCFVTDGTAGSGQGSFDIDGGSTTLVSPLYDLSGMSDPTISYWRWYSNDTGADPDNDIFVIDISDDGGSSWTNLETVGPNTQNSGGWIQASFQVSSVVSLTSQVQLRFIASDLNSGSIVEAAIDDFQINDFSCDDGGIGNNYCSPNPNSTGNTGAISASGSDAVADNNFSLTGTQLPNNQFGIFVNSMSQGAVQPPGSAGILCLSGQIGRHTSQIQSSGGNGEITISVDLGALPRPTGGPYAVQPGETWNFQLWHRDIGNTSNFTDGLSVTFN